MIVSLSKEGFSSKPTAPPQFNHSNYCINAEVTPETLCEKLSKGHILAPPVNDVTESNGKVDRRTANVKGRQYVMVDIESDDHSKIPEITPDTFSGYTGSLAPTFVYASYSDTVKGHRYHFVWCFDEFITDMDQNRDIWSRCRAVAKEIVGERFEDDESVKDLARICYGSYGRASFSTNGYKSYRVSDFASVEPFLSDRAKSQPKAKGATRRKPGVPAATGDGIYDQGDHFGFERRKDVIFTLFDSWKDADKVREIYESIDPNRKDPNEGESLIRSAADYMRQGRLFPTKEGKRICGRLGVLKPRNDFSKELTADVVIEVPCYINDKKREVLSALGKCTLLISPPGAGKTVFSQCLPGNVLVIQMMKSIVDSAKYGKGWVKVFDKKRFPKFWAKHEQSANGPDAVELPTGKADDRHAEMSLFPPVQPDYDPNVVQLPVVPPTKIVCTIDKLRHLDVEKLKHFDYIVVDESHIIFESSDYRALGFVIPMFSQLCDSEWSGKLVLMTGTPILETKYFPDIKVLNVTTGQKKTRECIITKVKKPEAALTEFIVASLKAGKKVFFPTNRSDARGRILSKIRRQNPELNFCPQVFSKPLHYEEDNTKIRKESKVPKNTNVLCCTTYLSVGLDIFDSDDWVIVTFNEWVAPQLVQFANRLREKDLYIHCFVSDEKKNDYDRVWWENEQIHRLIDGANEKNEDGLIDPIKHKALLDKYPCITWDSNNGRYVEDALLKDVFLDWVDYRQCHSDPDRLAKDMEGYGFTVSSIDCADKPKEPKAKRHASIGMDDNELLAVSLTNVFRQYVDFYKDEDKEYVDPYVMAHYITNVRPYIKKLFRIFSDVELDEKKMFSRVRKIIMAYFLRTVFDERLGREKHIFEGNALRRFVEGHNLSVKIESYSELFQKFYDATIKFAKSKDEFEKKDIDEFLNGQVRLYTTSDDDKLCNVILGVIKEYFKLFVTKHSYRKAVRYKNCTFYNLTVNQFDLSDSGENLPF